MAVVLKANALITAEELDEILQITIGDSDLSNTLINIGSDFIEKYCDRKFIKATYTREVYNGHGWNDLYLNNYPIVEDSVIVESWDTFNNEVSYEFVLNSDYLIYLEEGYIYKRGPWVKGHQNYRITYQAGYVTTAVPYDLKLACAKICSFLYPFINKDGVSAEKMGQYSITYDKAATLNGVPLSAEIINLLSMHINRGPYEL